MDYRPILQTQETDELYEAMLCLTSVEECYRFFEDLCTVNEIEAMAQRLHVAKLLKAGVTYHEIVEKTGVSTATISRINRCLRYGASGYNAILARVGEQSAGEEDV